jgi:2-keto-4-pentenoate hydratase/2-oxohepta-3-ene-1,7-dioic acid hydratase in catechol pathway
MRIIRFTSGGRVYNGQAIDEQYTSARRIDGELFNANYRVTDEVLKVDKLLVPLVPTDILCIGLNYRDHAAESASAVPKIPMLFIKASGTLNNPGDPIPIPRLSSMIDFEAELVVVIGTAAKNVSRERALDHVFGYTCGNDVSARDWQRQKELGGGQFARGKSFDGFCPLGPAIATRDEIPDANQLKLRSVLNGQVMQDHTTADMIFDVPELIASLSSTLTLRPGAVIMTGTPPGVGFARTPPVWLKAGDTITVEIERLGRLENPVTAEA